MNLSNLWVIWKNNVSISYPNTCFLLNSWNQSHFCRKTLFCIIVHHSSVCPVYYQMHNPGLVIYGYAHTLVPKGAWSSSSRKFSFNFFADSVTLPWIGWCHPYWLMKYRKILRHRYQYLKYCSTYEQHSITCVQEKHGNMDIYFTGLTNWTINVVWMNSKVPIPKFDNSSQYDKHILIHAIGKHINNYDNVIKCVP